MIGAVFRAPEARFRRRQTTTATRPTSNTAGQSHTAAWEEFRAARAPAPGASEPSAWRGPARTGLDARVGPGSLRAGCAGDLLAETPTVRESRAPEGTS
jgi:hypothetical protein